MNTTKVKQQLPSWFHGELYKEGDTVRNRFSGEEYELNNVELSMYDFIIGSTIAMDIGIFNTEDRTQAVDELHKGLDWFKKHNVKAYMILLD